MLKLLPLLPDDAVRFMREKGCSFADGAHILFAIGCEDETDWRGAITMELKNRECCLHQVYGDGTAQVQTLLYGAAWRAAKALGYERIVL